MPDERPPTWLARYGAALERWGRARDERHRAQVNQHQPGGVKAYADAVLAHEDAGEDVARIGWEMNADTNLMLRKAAEQDNPLGKALRALLAGAVATADQVEAQRKRIEQLERDVEELAEAVARLRVGEGDEWKVVYEGGDSE